MTIDVHPLDTFTIWENGTLCQYRSGKMRWPDSHTWEIGDPAKCERQVSNADAITVLKIAGHTIAEYKPEPVLIPFATHAVVNTGTNTCTGFRGTEEECKHEVQACWGEHYEVRPIAPAPLSPKMRAFIEAVAATSVHGNVIVAARELLAEG
jgi:hypothetical protein